LNKEYLSKVRLLMILAFCILATAPRADIQLTPWIFDLRKQFDECINTPADDLYSRCQDVLTVSYTLRREIAGALNNCKSANTKRCTKAFNDAGLPADRLDIANLNRCEMLSDLNEAYLHDKLSEGTCIEQLARIIESNGIPTTHNTVISCSINYVECLEIFSKGTKYWENNVWILHMDTLQAILQSTDFSNETSHRYYSLLEHQLKLKIDLANTNCSILTINPHRSNTRDHEICMGEAYAEIWLRMQAD